VNSFFEFTLFLSINKISLDLAPSQSFATPFEVGNAANRKPACPVIDAGETGYS